jgi:signal transduction histidine kinase
MVRVLHLDLAPAGRRLRVRTVAAPRAMLVALGLLVVATAVIAAVPELRLHLLSPELRVALEIAQACIAVFAALVLVAAEQGEHVPARNAFVAALVVIGVSNVAFGLGGMALAEAGVQAWESVALGMWLAMRYVAGVLFIAATLDRPAWTAGRLLAVGMAVAALVAGVLTVAGDNLPLPVAALPEAPGISVRVVSPLEDLVIAVVPGALCAVGAVLAGTVFIRSASRIYLWLSLALMTLACSMLHEVLYPAVLGGVLTSADVLRFVSVVLLSAGVWEELHRRIRDGAATVDGQAQELALQGELLASMRQFAAREEAFRSVVVHELATPLATLRAFAHVVERRQDATDDENVRMALAGIQAETRRLQELVDRMEELRRLEIADFRCVRRAVLLRALIEDAATYTRGLPGAHPVVVNCPVSLRAHLDPVRFPQALRNLLTNATRYAPARTPILLDCEVDGDVLRIGVEDDGPGVPLDERDRVLQKYARGRQGHEADGSGLGLYVTRRIAEAHDGTLYLTDAKRAGGLRAVIELPLV